MNFAIGNVDNPMLQQAGGAKKRKLSSYQKFVKKEFKVHQKNHPSKKAPEIIKMIAKKWRESDKH